MLQPQVRTTLGALALQGSMIATATSVAEALRRLPEDDLPVEPERLSARILAFPAAGSRLQLGGQSLRYRCDVRRPWTHLHFKFAALAHPTGRWIKDDRPPPAVPEVILATPWGDLSAILWNLGSEIDLVVGREAFGGSRPMPSLSPLARAGSSAARLPEALGEPRGTVTTMTWNRDCVAEHEARP